MNPVTAADCKQVVKDTGMQWLGHHRCTLCGCMVGWTFLRDRNAHPSWQEELGLDGPDDVIALYDPSCGCSSRGSGGEPRSWDEFAHVFNMQKPDVRARMWERFKAGKAPHERDD